MAVADKMGYFNSLLGVLGHFVVGVILSATLAPSKLFVALEMGLVAGVLPVALDFVGVQRKNRAVNDAIRQEAARRQSTAPAAAPPTQATAPAIAPPSEPVE